MIFVPQLPENLRRDNRLLTCHTAFMQLWTGMSGAHEESRSADGNFQT
jgi:hypothetical protein